MNTKRMKYILTVIFFIVGILSCTVVTDYVKDPVHHKTVLDSLDEKKTTVLELTAAATATSALITLIPGDVATPIAEKITDLTGYLLVVLCAIFLEKYLVTITGYVAFRYLIPAACVGLIISLYAKGTFMRNIALKVLILGIAVFLVVPAGVQVSGLIENTYASQIQAALEDAKETQKEIGDADVSEQTSQDSQNDIESTGGQNILDQAKQLISGVKDSVGNAIENAAVSSEELVARVQDTLNHFIEAVALMIITSCVIPLLVLLCFVWIVNRVFGTNLKLPGKGSIMQKER